MKVRVMNKSEISRLKVGDVIYLFADNKIEKTQIQMYDTEFTRNDKIYTCDGWISLNQIMATV